jgi:NAD(P)-dependent dehydrogenase (short-subunit alcohol dehydrogenase family)
MKLNNKVAVITGGSSGIGLSIAKKFHKEGAKVVIFGRKQEALDAAVAEVGAEVLAVQSGSMRRRSLNMARSMCWSPMRVWRSLRR